MKGSPKARVLLVDDDPRSLHVLSSGLVDCGMEVLAARQGQEALSQLEKNRISVVVCDLGLQDISAWELLKRIKQRYPGTGVILVTRRGSVEVAVKAIREGAADFFVKPIKLDELELSVTRASRSQVSTHCPPRAVDPRDPVSRIIGRSRCMREVFEAVEQVAPTNASVLILGESGTGKELLASAIHRLSPRASAQLVAVNCVAMVESLFESELFGHERGAFTGALRRRKGRFELAHRGTLFLDEVGDLSPAAQLKLLRALQEREIERVGGLEPIPVDVRVVSATNRDLEHAIKDNSFWPALYYRLKVVTIEIPPLRERPEDIPPLLGHFLRQFCEQYDKPVIAFDDEALGQLYTYAWPGNVRELRNMIESLVVSNRSGRITPRDLPPRLQSHSGSSRVSLPLGCSLQEVEQLYIRRTLEANAGDKVKAAKALGISKRTLYRRLKEYGLDDGVEDEEVVIPLVGKRRP